MGSYTRTMTVPFAVPVGYIEGFEEKVTEADDLLESDSEELLLFHGWKVFVDATEYNDEGFYPVALMKGCMEVYIVNESQFANSGDIFNTVFSEKKEDLIEFIKDAGLEGEYLSALEANYALQQTL